jgi:hypothetical protein
MIKQVKHFIMQILTTAVPQWVSILFIIAFCIPIVVIGNLAKEGASTANLNQKKYYNITIAFLLVFFLYASLMSYTGIFQQNTLPPRIFY